MRSTLILFSLFSTLLLPSQSQVQIPRDGDAVLLVIRIFDDPVEVTSKTQVKVYPTGTRDDSLLVNFAVDSGHLVYVTPGIYDVQAIQQHENEIVNIRWAEHPIVLRYPDKPLDHLEVINFQPGFGALQLLSVPGSPSVQDSWQFTLFSTSAELQEPISPVISDRYDLFVLPAGNCDLLARASSAPIWVTDIEVPPDNTRLKHLPTPRQ